MMQLSLVYVILCLVIWIRGIDLDFDKIKETVNGSITFSAFNKERNNPHLKSFIHSKVMKVRAGGLFSAHLLPEAQYGPWSPAGHKHWPLSGSQLKLPHSHSKRQLGPKNPTGHSTNKNLYEK
uniref:Uncharacterized protein n=1 Tax=Romanomermis culicivorax TaxID=13658 RepID=A0A915JRC9_ROMCU